MNSFDAVSLTKVADTKKAEPQSDQSVRYQLIFRGVREGFDRNSLHIKFSQLFKLTPQQVDRIFSAKRICLKGELTKAQAKAYREQLFALGFVVETPLQVQYKTVASLQKPAINQFIKLPDSGANEHEESSAMHQFVEPVYGPGIERLAVQSHIAQDTFTPLALSNLLLCMMSVGLWYPWAQVRQWRYCFANTKLAGQSFEFRGHPHYLLLAQLMLIAGAGALVAAFFLWPSCFVLGAIAYSLFLPAYFGFKDYFYTGHVRFANHKFNSRMTPKLAYEIFGLYPLLILISAGLAAPWMFRRMHQKLIATKSFGKFQLQTAASLSHYMQVLKPLLAAWIFVGLLQQDFVHVPVWLNLLLSAMSVWGLLSYWKLQMSNLLWNSTSCVLGSWRRDLTWQASVKWQLIYCTLFIFSFGILSPWLNAYRWRWMSKETAFLAEPRFKKWLKSCLED